MKRILAFILAAVTLLSLSGCSHKVTDPMAYPDYTFEGTPDTTQLRETAVKAMYDILTIQWYIENDIEYIHNPKKRAIAFEKNKTYAGVLYTKASTGLFQFFEYYNQDTGCLEYYGTADELKLELGSACADTLLWAWSTVCNSVSDGFYPIMMVPSNGFIPVGDYTIPEYIDSFHEYPSYAIIENTPEQVIYDAYAKSLPADALVSNKGDHAMMVVSNPTVVYLSDNAIDPEASFLLIQDQRTGNREGTFNAETLPMMGRINTKVTFKELYEEKYIPLTAAEFIGEKPYDKATVTVSQTECPNLNALKDITVESNYPLAVINIIATDTEGTQTILARKLFNGSAARGVPRSFNLSELNPQTLSPATGSVIQLEVVVSTGERFYPIEFTV